MPGNHQESPLLEQIATENATPLSIFDELNAISEEIERCRSAAQN